MLLENLDTYSKTYLIIAIASTIMFVIKLVLMLVGGDSVETDVEFHSGDTHVSSDSAFVLFSVESILSFLMGFGWAGLTAKNEWHLPIIASVPIAFIVGVSMMLFITFLMMQVRKLNKTTEFDIYDCIGKTGSVYTELKKDKIGQVKIIASGKSRILNAINRTQEKINSFSSIIVTDIEDNNLIVAEYKGEMENGRTYN